jgi:very-short-patch-repair endonuclease
MVYLGKTVIKEMHLNAKPDVFKFAQELRKHMTESEKALWKVLRKYRNSGFIFRRQHPLHLFIADFYCHKLKLIIEVDGEVHNSEESLQYDEGRTAELEKYGITVLRFSNEQVLHDKSNTALRIDEFIIKLASPSPQGEGDQRG